MIGATEVWALAMLLITALLAVGGFLGAATWRLGTRVEGLAASDRWQNQRLDHHHTRIDRLERQKGACA